MEAVAPKRFLEATFLPKPLPVARVRSRLRHRLMIRKKILGIADGREQIPAKTNQDSKRSCEHEYEAHSRTGPCANEWAEETGQASSR